MKNCVIEAIEKNKIIVIVRGVGKDDLINLARALYDGGIRLMEITYDASDMSRDAEIADCIRTLSNEFEGKMFIGAGTVLTERQVEMTAKAGGKFVISPNTSEKVIRKTNSLGLVSIPGALTPSEVQCAHEFGADFVKLFPISSLGVNYLKAIVAPLSHIKLLAVGGVDLTNLSEYLSKGACGIGIGGNVVDRALISAGRFDEISALAKKYVDEVLK